MLAKAPLHKENMLVLLPNKCNAFIRQAYRLECKCSLQQIAVFTAEAVRYTTLDGTIVYGSIAQQLLEKNASVTGLN